MIINVLEQHTRLIDIYVKTMGLFVSLIPDVLEMVARYHLNECKFIGHRNNLGLGNMYSSRHRVKTKYVFKANLPLYFFIHFWFLEISFIRK